jgi:hypothetical protein
MSALAESLYKQAINGENFENLAKEYSAEPYSSNNGDYGYREIDSFHNEIKEKINYAIENEIIKPFQFDNAWWILQIKEKTQSIVKMNIIKLDIKASNETISNNKKKMEAFNDIATKFGFDRAINEMNLKKYDAKNVSNENPYIEGIGNIQNFIDRFIIMKEKNIHEPILMSNINAYVVFQIEKITPKRNKNIYEVKNNIKNEIIKMSTNEYIIKKAQEERKNPDRNNSIHDKINTNINYNNYHEYSYDFFIEIINTNEGDYTDIHLQSNSAIFAKVINKKRTENTPFYDVIKNTLKTELQSIEKEKYYSKWINQQMKKAKIVDKRPKNI